MEVMAGSSKWRFDLVLNRLVEKTEVHSHTLKKRQSILREEIFFTAP